MSGRFLPPDHSRGDANTIGGYMAVHARPAAFEGSDGMSYSVEIVVDETEIVGRPFGAYFLFLRWREWASRASRAISRPTTWRTAQPRMQRGRTIGAMTLGDVKELLGETDSRAGGEPSVEALVGCDEG